MTTQQPPALGRNTASRVTWVLLVSSTLTVMAGATISPALPAMNTHFAAAGNSQVLIRLVLSITALAIAMSAPFVGGLIIRFGAKLVLLTGAIVYAVAGSSGLAIDSLIVLLASRFILGMAVACVMVASITLITDWHGGTSRNKVLGTQAAFSGLGGVVFLSLGGFLAEMSWRGPFAIYLLAMPIAVLVALFVEEKTPGSPSFAPITALSIESARERKGVLGQRSFVIALFGLAFASQVIFYTIPTQLPFHLQNIAGSGAVIAGFIIAWMVAVQSGASLTYRFVAPIGNRLTALISFTLIGAGLIILGMANTLPVSILGLTITALGTGLVMPNLNSWVASTARGKGKAQAFGGLTSAMFAGQFLSPALAQPLIIEGNVSFVYIAAGILSAVIASCLLLRIGQPTTPSHKNQSAPIPDHSTTATTPGAS